MKKKNKKIVILIVVVSVILIVFCVAFFFYKSKGIKITLKKDLQVNIHEKVYNTDFIKKIENGSILSKKESIDTTKLGKKNIKIKIQDIFHKTSNYSFQIVIVDKEKPVITHQERFETTKGSQIDLMQGVSVEDNSQEEIQATIVGDYDFFIVGTYELEYVAQDSSGNETREKFVLEVKEKTIVPTEEYVEPDREFTTSKGFKGVVRDGITYIDGIMIANKTYALPSSYNPGGLTAETNAAYEEMVSASWSEGIELWIVSGYRSYNYQKKLYNNYVAQDGKEEADTYSARPGHSEHQTGLAFDLNDVNRDFGTTPAGIWLSNNAWKYGFILRYPEGKTNETGYIYEAWHFRYVGKDLAKKLYNNGDWITLETYFGINSEYTY